jgi:hypothetical protein
MLLLHFEDRPGYNKVLRGEYSIEEALREKSFDRRHPWQLCARPGLKVDMSMIFTNSFLEETSCPRCQTYVAGAPKAQHQW